MKYIFFCFALVCITYTTSSQNDSLINSLKIELPTAQFSKGVLFETVEIPFISSTTDKPDIKAEDWDTTVYNPYQNILQNFPLVLNFKDSTYASPVPHPKVVTSHYGWRKGRPHKGIDIDLVTGDSVAAVLDGIVRYAKYTRGFGNTVVVRHYNGLESTYAHLSKIGVKANDSIVKGQYVGKGGNTGNSRGSHLHLELSYKGHSIHPEYLFDFSPKNTIRAEQVWVTQKWTHARYHNSRQLSKVKVIKSADEAALVSLAKQPKFYVVKKGDTLYGISKRNNMSVAMLCNTNAIKQNATLKIGQKLVLEL
ncbi:peptidoglycan DD-metalloendopeptidase family protein [Winogradskyella bathintestinalis]|uniref:Peptidoglycan DD-metalloendopeptidase family protein n=1 Tax=Winogradskyella bathintestinalis TaxID=3035208 RepID=A0ABT7ZXG5_9FLAO|nr:peptidoglycan DD-metalloendopeptidase family protein [Winogradskyella bathintestinalis]MDN3493693.1 peptidoglycan DD-metalloendopeptidase family protein [Winogradskyella bathintestinalis]